MIPLALAAAVAPILAPHLPALLALGIKIGEGAATEVGKKVGNEAWERAKALWSVLRPKVETKPSIVEAMKDVAAAPDDADAQAALRLQLRKLFTEDASLASEIEGIWERTKPSEVSVTASGERSVAIGGNATGNMIVTGDSNTLGPKP